MREIGRSRRVRASSPGALALLLVLAVTPLSAQTTLDWPVGEFHPFILDSGELANNGSGPSQVWEGTVAVEGAAWLRLHFEEIVLDRGSVIRMTSAADGAAQELDAYGMAMWQNTSAYFNGDTVRVELIAGPQTSGNRVLLERVAMEFQGGARECGVNGCGYCGPDDREPSDEDWTGRLLPVGCTGSVYNEQSCLVSAGHCVDGGGSEVIQFRVPASGPDCALMHPPVEDQFPITDYLFLNNGPGYDWAVMTSGPNNLGLTAYEQYGVLREISPTVAMYGQTISVWGYGIDDDPSPTRNQTQQTHTGTIDNVAVNFYRLDLDLTHGNSGSAVIRLNKIIGVVTHCPCPSWGTRVDAGFFELNRGLLCGGIGGGYCHAKATDDNYEYISNVAMGSINNTSGPSYYSDHADQSTDLIIGTGDEITVTIETQWETDAGACWVDWNQDGDFDDADEMIPTAWSGLGPYTATITPPITAVPGATRMRIRIQDVFYDPDFSPCGDTLYGEVEDYSINVIVGCGGDGDCDDGDACNGLETCVAGTCLDGIPPQRDGDMNGTGGTNGEDIPIFVAAVIAGSTDPSEVCPGDFSLNGVLDLGDVSGMVGALLLP